MVTERSATKRQHIAEAEEDEIDRSENNNHLQKGIQCGAINTDFRQYIFDYNKHYRSGQGRLIRTIDIPSKSNKGRTRSSNS